MTAASTTIASGAGFAAIALLIAPVAAQAPTTQELLLRINAQDRRIAELTQNAASQNSDSSSGASFQQPKGLPLTASYDGGLRLRSTNPDSPFELKVKGRVQLRLQGFNSRTDAAVVNPNRTDFEIERGRLEFRGTLFDKNAHFFINLDADTDDNHQVVLQDFWVNYDFAEKHSLYIGKGHLPGSRDWVSGSTRTHLIDRSLATTFFRPDRSLGVWAIGKMSGDINYRVMVGNGLKAGDLKPSEIDSNFVYAGSFWKDLGAPYGKGYADLQHHEKVAVRVGTTASYTKQDEGQSHDPSPPPKGGTANEEAGAIRLSNGMKLSDPTGLAIHKYTYQMAAADVAVKYLGFAANTEFFFRSIDDVRTTAGPAARTAYYDWGGYVDVGYMIIEKTLEPVLRVSSVQGAMGDSWEYAAGVNYYVDGTHHNKLSIDIAKLDGSPTSSSSPGYRVGDEGWLFRLQWQVVF